eukprot:TRINITY_DN38122_c0_g1_i1.p1 TRINITY_DN38122_c0_g1~~TRINITY_DN38122_c0_g1_i1.p1  ORF type:complete len:568 (+),score=127.87 TRINITY_DN38122_c0_g1_i1:217-1704(+)
MTGVVKLPKKDEPRIDPLPKWEVTERGLPEKWPDYSWYYTLGSEFEQSQEAIERPFKRRYASYMQNKTHVVTIPSAPHPSCAAAEILRGTKYVRKYGMDFPCRRPGGKTWDGAEFKIVHDAVYYKGDVWSTRGKVAVSWGGTFSYLKGKKQPYMEDTILMKQLPVPVNESGLVIEVGYYQPPTDYHSMYHSFVNVLLPMFHATLPFRVNGLESKIALIQPTGKARQEGAVLEQMKKEKDSCVMTTKTKCLNTEHGRMLEVLAPAGVFMEDSAGMVRINKLIIGAPTTCQPLWMTDAVIIGTADVQELRSECERLYWIWRGFWVRKYEIPTPPIAVKGQRVLWATRRDSWARNLLNEEAIFSRIRSLGDQIQTTDFRMPMKDQFTLLQSATHYVTPYGASHLHALLLPPSSICISIDTSFPAVSGVTIELPWLHYFHFRADRQCDPLYPTGRISCLTSTPKKPLTDSLSHLSINVTAFVQMYMTTIELTTKAGVGE